MAKVWENSTKAGKFKQKIPLTGGLLNVSIRDPENQWMDDEMKEVTINFDISYLAVSKKLIVPTEIFIARSETAFYDLW